MALARHHFSLKILSLIAGWVSLSHCAKLLPPAPQTKAAAHYQLKLISGNAQVGNAKSLLPSAFVVRVIDQNTNAAADNAQVTWAVQSGGGRFLAQYTHTSPSGDAPATFYLGDAPGANTVSASSATGDTLIFTATGIIGAASSSTSTITGSSPIEPDGINFSSVSIFLKDSNGNAVSGTVPTFSATGSGNVYQSCTASDASGLSQCKLMSTVPETKILSITSPVAKVGGSVVFATGPVSASRSSISASGPVIANGVASSTVSIVLKDAYNVGVSGIVPSFSATDTGLKNTYGTCSATNSSGQSSCSLKSTKAELKYLNIISPVSVSGGNVSFIPGPPSTSTSSIVGSSPIENDGVAQSTISVSLKDAFSNPVTGMVPAFSATNTGSTNSYGVCSAGDSSGSSTCALSSTTAETKSLSLTSPLSFTGGSVVFAPGQVVAARSTITGSGPVVADGVATSQITITLRDSANVPVPGTLPSFSASDLDSTNTYGTCSATNASGVSFCLLSSLRAQNKTLSITSPVSMSGSSVSFVAASPTASTSSISGTSNTVADGVSASTITITLRDANSNLVSGMTPSFQASDSNSSNAYGSCSTTSAAGISTCTLKSTKAEVKTLSLVTPVSLTGPTATFIHGSADLSQSSITGSGPVQPDGVSTSTISINLKDAYGNPVDAVVPTFQATDTGSTNQYGACTISSASGSSTCTLSSSTPETKTLRLTSPLVQNGGQVVFVAGSASSTYSSITGTTNVVANGTSTSSISVTLKDSANLAVVGVTPAFSASNSGNGNVYGVCSPTNSSGVSTCSLASTRAESKTLSITSPINLSGPSVTFVAGPPVAANSQITGTGPVTANGSASSNVTLVLYDANNNPVAGIVPSFNTSAPETGNTYQTCSSSSTTGASSCTFTSTYASVKTLAITSPVSKSGGTVSFTAGSANAAQSSISASGSVPADGTSISTVAISLKDIYGNAISGIVPTFSATNTANHNTLSACSSTDALGNSTCTLKSTQAETKTINLLTPVSKSGGSVVFTQAVKASNSSITAAGGYFIAGSSNAGVNITLKDYLNVSIAGVTPTFSATGTGNTYGACSSTASDGTSSCTLRSSQAETKTLSVQTPTIFNGGTIVFH